MKTIEPVSIWDNGVVKTATVLDTNAINVTLGTLASFAYNLFSQNEDGTIANQIATGVLVMKGDAYAQWTVDAYAWDWVAQQLNLTITGDYIPPVPPQPEPQPETPIDPAVESPAV